MPLSTPEAQVWPVCVPFLPMGNPVRPATGLAFSRYESRSRSFLSKKNSPTIGLVPQRSSVFAQGFGGRAGPAWNGAGNYLVWSDIPNNRQMRWLEEDGHVDVFRKPSNFSNGNTFDWQGRQLSCEHQTRPVVRYEQTGEVTILAEKFSGKLLNEPNDIVAHPNGDIWFTDPGYGALSIYEGDLIPQNWSEIG